MRPGFSSNTLTRSDDSSAGPVSIGFRVDFYGLTFNQLFVNNNGNVTFDNPLASYTPFDLTSTERKIIAPFFSDVDTRRAGNAVTYGVGAVDGRMAFGANWKDVDCFSGNSARTVRNAYQLILIDRSDTGPGNFDFEINIDKIQWEAGQASGGNSNCLGGDSARVGFSNGTGDPGTAFELPGSGVAGAFLDSGPASTALIHNRMNSNVLGRYRFSARNGVIVTCEADDDDDDDDVCDDVDNCPLVANPDQEDADEDGIGDACDECPYDADNDLDGDGVCGDVDLCAGTVLPEETVPSVRLGVNRWADVDGDGVFDIRSPPGGGQGPRLSFTIEDTGGCSCEQIIDAHELGDGHRKFGCSISAMEDWIAEVPSALTLKNGGYESMAGCSVGGDNRTSTGLWALTFLGLLMFRRRRSRQ